MPLHVVTLIIPAKTPAYTPVSNTLRPGANNLSAISALFPNGCLGVVGVRVSLGGVQFAPLSGWLHGNNEVVRWDENRPLGQDPRLIIEGYSDADDWPHTVELRFFFE